MSGARFATTEEKIGAILGAQSFAAIPPEAMPSSHRDNYYFVSYSHRDYKTVLPDILRLEALGVPLWYDREMHIGENWQEVAELYLSKFQCAGIIFYLSENAIASPACNREVEYALTHRKHFLSVNIPLPGRTAESGYAMLCEMERRGFVPPEGLKENFGRAFSDEILYLDAADTPENKAARITAIRREPLFIIRPTYLHMQRMGIVMLAGCRDNGILSADLTGTFETEGDGEYRAGGICAIGACAFTNCFGLQRVTLPLCLRSIGESAFRNCTSLSHVDLSDMRGVSIEKNAFCGCTALESVDLSDTSAIGDMAFCGCKRLDVPVISGHIGSDAFAGTRLSEVRYTDPSPVIGRWAFRHLSSLRRFFIEGRFETDLGDNAFENCASLVSVGPFSAPWYFEGGRDACRIGAYAFCGCKSLEEISFSGAWDAAKATRMLRGCSSLRKIDFDIAGTILPRSFAEACTALTEVCHSEHFTVIGDEAFYGCIALQSIDLAGAEQIGNCALSATGLQSLYLPAVRDIGPYAFANAKELERVTIGANCRVIEDAAFSGCSSLSVVRILSETVGIPHPKEVFDRCDSLRTVWFCAPSVWQALLRADAVGRLTELYIGEKTALCDIDLSDFERAESAEPGFLRYLRRGADPSPEGGEETEDVTSPETNAPCPGQPRYREPDFARRYLGREAEITHLRLRRPHRYFVEEAVCDGDTVDHIVVSVHDGHSFLIDGSLIRGIAPAADIPAGERLCLDDPHELDGMTCRLTANGVVHFAVVGRVDVFPLPVIGKKAEGFLQYAVDCLYYDEDGIVKAVSGLDADSVIVFDENFQAGKVIER